MIPFDDRLSASLVPFRAWLGDVPDGGHAVVPADPEVVALRDVVGQDNPGVLSDAAHDGEQHVLLERLRLVDDHEGIVQAASADVREREDLEHAAVSWRRGELD